MTTIKRILSPTDLSDECRLAFELACKWATEFGAELHVFPELTNPYP